VPVIVAAFALDLSNLRGLNDTSVGSGHRVNNGYFRLGAVVPNQKTAKRESVGERKNVPKAWADVMKYSTINTLGKKMRDICGWCGMPVQRQTTQNLGLK
jgi:hypothetical protein